MADDKNFKELVKEIQDLNKSITKQNVERADSLNDLVNAQNKTTEMVTRRLTKAQTAQLEKDNEQIRVAKEESDRQADADKKAQELEDKKFTMKKFNDRVSNKLKKAPSALLGAAKFATYQNRVMRNLGKGVGKLNRGLGIGKALKTGKDTFFGIIKRLIQGGLIIGGIIALDKFFNSEYWPKTIDFIENKLIPGIKDFFNFMKDKFGPMTTKFLFGEKGTFAKPTGGLYGAIKDMSSWFSTTFKDIADFMKEDDTGSKFKNTVKSFFKLIGAIFGMGRGEGDISKATYQGYNKGYFENIKDAAKKFKDDFVELFESLSRAFAKGVFGYETDEESFFKGLRDDLTLMFKKIVRGIGEAFYEAYPAIAGLLGISSAAENRVTDYEATSEGSGMKFMLEDALNRGGPQEVARVVGSMKDKSPFIQYMNMLNAAEQQRMLYGGQMLAGGYESGVIKGVDLATGGLVEGPAGKKTMVAQDIEMFRLMQKQLTNEREKLEGAPGKIYDKNLDVYDKDGNLTESGRRQGFESLDKIKSDKIIKELQKIEQKKKNQKNNEVNQNMIPPLSFFNSNKGGDVFNSESTTNNRMVAFADSNIIRYSRTG